jgi:hypothetical protein
VSSEPSIVVLETVAPPIVVEVEVSDLPDYVEVAVEGPVGPRGLSGETSENLTLVADGAIGGHRVVVWVDGKAGLADPSNVSHGWLVLGVSTHAAADGDQLDIQKSGQLSDSSFSFSPASPIFLGPAGVLTNSPPSLPGSVFSMRMGTALESNTINIAVGIPIALT